MCIGGGGRQNHCIAQATLQPDITVIQTSLKLNDFSASVFQVLVLQAISHYVWYKVYFKSGAVAYTSSPTTLVAEIELLMPPAVQY